MAQPSCKDCIERKPGCHALCESYQNFAKERREELDRIRKIKDAERDVIAVSKNGLEKYYYRY